MAPPAPCPSDEPARLRALHSYAILDTPVEQAFDDLVRLATLFFRTPIALVTLIDERRQWFKSSVGVSLRETSRDLAFCAYTILADSVMVVPDARADARFADNPLVTGEPWIRFYAGIALRTRAGHAIGSLAVIDTATREFGHSEREALECLGRQVMALLDARSAALLVEREKREEAQSALEIRSAALDHALTGFDIVDMAGQFVYANPAYLRMWGYARFEEIVGTSPVSHCADPSVPETIIGALLEKGEHTLEFTARRKDGSTFEVLMASRAFTLPSGRQLFLSSSLDMTERRNAEAELRRTNELLRQSQKMDAIGQLSGGVAHDFNNILTVIQCHVALLKRDGDLAPTALESVNEISGAAERAADLTRKLLAFSRQQPMQQRDFELGGVVAQMIKMLERILGEDIRLTYVSAPEPTLVYADMGMIEQVLLNLCVNARDAMPRGGRLRVETALVTVDAESARRSPGAREGRFARLTVADEGSGIAPEILSRIFEPFFTTKDVGKGTGLGLATVYGITTQHQGWVEVDTDLAHGTTFRVYLPAVERVSHRAPTLRAPASVVGGRETILCVEDEPALRSILARILLRSGYTVLTAVSGRAALEVWAEHRASIALLLTDLVMPDGLGGFELAARLRRQSPGLKVVYMSGYSAQMASGEVSLEEGVNFVSKPFNPEKLARTVRTALDRA